MKIRALLVAAASLTACAALAASGPEDIRRAAEKGDVEQQVEMGVLYEYGFGLSKNTIPALAWYILAAEQGNAQAIKHRDALQARMTAEQVAEAQRQADQWRKDIAQARAADRPSTPPASTTTVPVAAPSDAAPATTPATDSGDGPVKDETVPVAAPVAPAPNQTPTDQTPTDSAPVKAGAQPASP